MSDKPIPPLPAGITQEDLDKISGGGCTMEDISQFLEQLKTNYDHLIDFTSYVIERVAGP